MGDQEGWSRSCWDREDLDKKARRQEDDRQKADRSKGGGQDDRKEGSCQEICAAQGGIEAGLRRSPFNLGDALGSKPAAKESRVEQSTVGPTEVFP